ncbi:uncharacterized protein BP01DRAFT_333180 [Aspergillus saccharolyticus JOP 1030-1]|uniref:Sequence orphan n=1 Tax=Aspergillus saccharolyticus JOP 1030-1 TaxID=1450539 RepID=A0A318ZXC0_9EURO|nr:hypothetical protein BP01DRAFT_333180 [Aspergillus saccharolyticus JOP 1030-1]PYH48963.1 hypothetical protein BP01DRAFT_333180 [Aspergillus saccharolyticus JOP 1030-1]
MSPDRSTIQQNSLYTTSGWNSELQKHLTGDIAAGVVSATIISPIVTIIDRTIVERLALNRPLLRTLGANTFCSIFQPRKFYISKPFLIVWSLYAATYCTANVTDTCIDHLPPLTDKRSTANLAATLSFLPTYAVNVYLGILKDVNFAQVYGRSSNAVAVAARVPRAAYMSFLFRDSVTIFSSFNLAPWMASSVPDWVATGPHTKAMISQLVLPAAVQFANTPLHLLGLDWIARPQTQGLAERWRRVRRDWASSSTVRAARVLPAFGVGCIMNTELRDLFQHH